MWGLHKILQKNLRSSGRTCAKSETKGLTFQNNHTKYATYCLAFNAYRPNTKKTKPTLDPFIRYYSISLFLQFVEETVIF